jgi:hypothetical protein
MSCLSPWGIGRILWRASLAAVHDVWRARRIRKHGVQEWVRKTSASTLPCLARASGSNFCRNLEAVAQEDNRNCDTWVGIFHGEAWKARRVLRLQF